MTGKFLKTGLFFLAALTLWFGVQGQFSVAPNVIAVEHLPSEARHTLALIKRGGPFPYEQDGRVFRNYERLLPEQKRGYYHEFTVPTPGERDRGARRIVSGGRPGAYREFFYTDDHYASFRRIKE